jgi:sRNA-binding carbon storage regulator CsrA
VRIGIDAPRDAQVHRAEIFDRVQAEAQLMPKWIVIGK